MQDNYFQATMDNWRNVADTSLNYTINVNTSDGEIKIKLLLGTDAVHGNQHVIGLVIIIYAARGNIIST